MTDDLLTRVLIDADMAHAAVRSASESYLAAIKACNAAYAYRNSDASGLDSAFLAFRASAAVLVEAKLYAAAADTYASALAAHGAGSTSVELEQP